MTDKDVSSLHKKIDKVTSIVTKNTVVLEEHQRRSLANERRLDQVERFMYEHRSSHSTKISVVRDVSILLGIITVLLKLFDQL